MARTPFGIFPLHTVLSPVEGVAHGPVTRASDVVPPADDPVQLGSDVLSRGTAAEVARSKLKLSHVFETELKIWVPAS